MFAVLKKWATVGVAAAAVAVSLGLASVADMAEARPIYVEIQGVDGDVTPNTAAPERTAPQKRVSVAQMRRILRGAKPSGPRSSKLVQRPAPPPPPGTPGSYSDKKPSGGGVLGGGITCDSLGLCFCSGAAHCNAFIAVCVEHGGTLSCTEHDGEGRPTGCSCFK